MPLYKNPDFRRLPPGLAAVFASCGQQDFFGLPQWYDLLVRFGLPEGTEVRIYTDERPGSMLALPLLVSNLRGQKRLVSLANFYSVEHDLISASGSDLDRGLASVVAEINAERPRWSCLTFAELDPIKPSYQSLARGLRDAGLMVECTVGAATWYEKTFGLSFADYLAARPSQLRNTWRRKRASLAASGRLRAA